MASNSSLVCIPRACGSTERLRQRASAIARVRPEVNESATISFFVVEREVVSKIRAKRKPAMEMDWRLRPADRCRGPTSGQNASANN
jgi:hypothetical protein